MNVLDENVPESQRALLRRSHVALRQIGHEVGRAGMKDDQVLALLHHLDQPTFFTLDDDFYDRRLCHEGYCLVHLDIDEERVAEHIRKALAHRELNTKAKRMGHVIRVLKTGLVVWRMHQEQEDHLSWE
jgi:aspartate/glutamate racemase